jgi:hypothetical protein
MGVFTKQKPREFNRRESLAGVAVVNEGVSLIEDDETRKITLKVRQPRGFTFFDRFRPPVVERKYELDELGSFVMAQIDGQKTAGKLVDVFAEHYGVNRRESELSVVSFLKMLMQRRIISVVIDAGGERSPGAVSGRASVR